MKPKLIFITRLYDLYKAAGVMILTLVLGCLFHDLSGFRFMNILTGIAVVAFVLVLFFIEQNKKNIMAYVILMGIGLLFLILIKLLRVNPGEIFTGLVEYVKKRNQSGWEYHTGYACLTGIVICIPMGVAVFFIQKFRTARFIVASGLWIGMIIMGFMEIPIGRITMMLLLLYCLINLSDVCNLLFNKNVLSRDSENVAFYLFPFFLLMVVLVALLPVAEHPVEWKTVRHIYRWAVDTTQNTFANIQMKLGIENKEYGMSFTGYSGKGNLGNGLTGDSTEQFWVKSSKTQGNVYMIGSVFDTYTGKKWEKRASKERGQEKDYQMDYYEILYALTSDEDHLSEEMRSVNRESLDITFGGIRTSTIFYPQKTLSINPISQFAYDDFAPNAVFGGVYSKGTRYETEYLDINYGSEDIQRLLRNMDAFDFETTKLNLPDIISYLNDYDVETSSILKKTDIPENMNQLFEKRADQIQTNYTGLPAGVPRRVYEKTEEITKDAENDYDKCKAIEEYLNTFEYTLTPEQTGREDDFVDRFLFETKEGYCTYFASAMAVMGRTQGIPTRYVEGFCLDYSNYLGNDMFQITGTDAHAWCEAYIEGAGWIPFEATAGKSAMRYKAWNMNESYMDKVQTVSQTVAEKQIEDEEEDESGAISWENSLNDIKSRIWTGVVFVFCVILFFLVFMILYYFLLNRQRVSKYRSSDRKTKISLRFLNMIKIMELKGYMYRESSTVTDIYQAMEQVLEMEGEVSHQLMESYFKCRYSGKEVDADDLELYEKINSKVEEAYLKTCSLRKKIDYHMFRKVI